ncbi:MAG: flagellar biosynthesis anti-sigma factor FlgM [Gammaproteobacteria bacterium]|nr:flagellar biosynthesis anti-sigma factor FlgM [Gammaproteobacteria bacterium]NNJ72101.1 flagellar biosynthesis anti-sigma factor FlgM [Enterobacterales bacterium]
MSIDLKNITANQTDATGANAKLRQSETDLNTEQKQQKAVSDDSVVLSDKAKVVQSLISEISQPPKTDSQRIDALRATIASGDYSVTAEQIATKLLDIDLGYRDQSNER